MVTQYTRSHLSLYIWPALSSSVCNYPVYRPIITCLAEPDVASLWPTSAYFEGGPLTNSARWVFESSATFACPGSPSFLLHQGQGYTILFSQGSALITFENTHNIHCGSASTTQGGPVAMVRSGVLGVSLRSRVIECKLPADIGKCNPLGWGTLG